MIEWWWTVLSFLFGMLIGSKAMVVSLKHFGFLDEDYPNG